MVLDVKSTFDALVTRYTPDAAARERILGNRFYRHISAALAGSHEYMAMEKLPELTEDRRWDSWCSIPAHPPRPRLPGAPTV